MAMFSQTTSQRLRSFSPSPSPERSQPLHNFSLPPLLKWGSHKILRSGGLRRGPSSFSSCKPPPDTGIEEIREKLMVHLHTAAKNMKLPVPREGEEGEGEVDGSAAATRPWNLRKRRAACAAPATEEIGEVPSVPAEGQLKSSRLRSMAAERGGGEKRKERRKFSAVLSRDEIEEDFFIITGSKPSRRPKKRSRIAQKQVEVTISYSYFLSHNFNPSIVLLLFVGEALSFIILVKMGRKKKNDFFSLPLNFLIACLKIRV